MKNEFLQPSQLFVEKIPGEPPSLENPLLEELTNVYADVFAGPPWNEYTQCSTQGTFYGKETKPGENCSCCNMQLALAYPFLETKEYITKELQRPDATLVLLRNGKDIAGFSWGFSYENPEAFAQEKYKTVEMQNTIKDLLIQQGIEGKFYYLSESGIKDDPQLRGRGISNQFHSLRLAEAKKLGIPALQRTSCEGPMYRTSSKYMQQIMGPEVRVDTIARSFTRTGTIVNNCLDKEIEPRVLFVVK